MPNVLYDQATKEDILKGLYVPSFSDIDAIGDFAAALQVNESVVLDFSKAGFVVPTGMLLLASVISSAIKEGRVAATVGTTPNDYAANMGFYDACGIEVPRHHASGSATYYPITKHDVRLIQASAAKLGRPVGAQINVMVGRLAYLITRQTSGNLFFTVKYCLREILRNVAEHSESEDLLVMGQFWPLRRDFELAVLDRGIGLRRALANNPRFDALSSDRKAIRIALLPSTSGHKIYDGSQASDAPRADGEWENSGFGLYVTSQMARRTGRFLIGSGNARLELSGNSMHYGGFFLQGTLVSMTINVDSLGWIDTSLKTISDRGEAFARRYLMAGADVMASAASRLIMDNGA